MLAPDSLVLDLIFQRGAQFSPETLIAALGGEEVVEARKILDPDMYDPRFEMELSPSMPFRRRGERRLLIIDDSVAPMREDPRTDYMVDIDLRAEKDRLVALCESLPVRLGRISALGSWGDAVIVSRDARDLRGVALIAWALDPTVDVDGKKRGGPLSQPEFQAKLAAFPKRLEERSEKQILSDLADARLTRQGDLLVVDVLEDDGTWDLRRSLALEKSLAAIATFSLIPGAPARDEPGDAGDSPAPSDKTGDKATAAAQDSGDAGEPPEATEPVKTIEPLRITELDGRIFLIFPPERFDLDVAAQLGKKDYDNALHSGDPISGPQRDMIYRDGAEFIAPLEFLSEVFVDGKPLSRSQFEQNATRHEDGMQTLEAHCPRFGRVVLLVVADGSRFISSARSELARVAALVT